MTINEMREQATALRDQAERLERQWNGLERTEEMEIEWDTALGEKMRKRLGLHGNYSTDEEVFLALMKRFKIEPKKEAGDYRIIDPPAKIASAYML